MKFNTQSKSCILHYGDRELSFLIYKIMEIESREYGSYDPALLIYYNILDVLLSLNEAKTIKFIESIDNYTTFETISKSFGAVSGIFQSKDFIEKIEGSAKKYESNTDYKIILENIDEAKNALDINES